MAACSCGSSLIPWSGASNNTSSSGGIGKKNTFASFRIRALPFARGHSQLRRQHSSSISRAVYARLLKCSAASNFQYGDGNNTNNNNNNSSNNNNGGGGGDGDCWGWWWNDDNGSSNSHRYLLLLLSKTRDDGIFTSGNRRRGLCFLLSLLACFYRFRLPPALARATTTTTTTIDDENHEECSVWEVRGGNWTRFIPDSVKDTFVATESGSSSSSTSSPLGNLWLKCRDICMGLMLPEGYPDSVTSDYLDYSLWRGVQGVASQISGILATQAMLYAVGLGQGVIPTAAAINWVLKDGIGHLSKIFLSNYGRHFDVNPKGWKLFADLLENAAFGLEMLTPAFPHYFVLIGAVAGAGRSAATLIQAATRSCFFAGFAAQRNFAEVIAKGEAQGMVSKSIGIVLGIALANCIGSSTSLSLVSFAVITWVHMYCNLKSYQSIQLRTFNPYRGSLVFSEYLLSGQVPPVKEVNDEEPLFPAVPILNAKPEFKVQSAVLSEDAKDAAAEIDRRLQLGAKLSNVVNNKQDALALFDLYRSEGYILVEHKDTYCVILKENCSQQDMLKSLFQANYLYWLERNAGIELKNVFDDCRPGGRLQMSLEYVQRELNHAKYDWELAGWAADGLIARPLPTRIHS